MEPLIIKQNKFRTFLLFLGALTGVYISIWLFNEPSSENDSFFGKLNEEKHMLLGVACFMASSFAVWYSSIKLFDSKPSLIVNDEGIYDNSNAASIGFISWETITDVGIITIRKRNILCIYINNNEEVLSKVNFLKRIFLKGSISWYRTPIGISAINLNSDIFTIHNHIANRLKEFKSNQDDLSTKTHKF